MISGLSEKNQRLWSVAAEKSEVLEEGVVWGLQTVWSRQESGRMETNG